MNRRHRQDSTHADVRAALEAMGYVFLDTSQTDLGFDAIVVRHGRMVPIEIKDGRKPPSARQLTPHEADVHRVLKANGIHVEIITGVDASLDVLRQPERNYYR